MKTQNNIGILDKSPSVSKEEIESYMDFEAVLDQSGKTKRIISNQMIKGSLILIGIILFGVVLYHFTQSENNTPSTEALISHSQKVVELKETNHSKIIEELPLKEPVTNHSIPAKSLEEEKNTNQRDINKEGKEESKTIVKAEKQDVTIEPTYIYAEAEPVEGLTYLYAYFRENLTYPDELRKDSIEGVVLISFVILKDSTVGSVKVVQSLGEKFDNEAVRVINNMPKWAPATINSTPVSSRLSIPLTFNIEK